MRQIKPDTIVRVMDPDVTPAHEEWRGTFAEFDAANSFDESERTEIVSALAEHGLYVFGGGAQGLFVVEVIDVAAGLSLFGLMYGQSFRFQRRDDGSPLTQADVVEAVARIGASDRPASLLMLLDGEAIWQTSLHPVEGVRDIRLTTAVINRMLKARSNRAAA